MKEQLIAEIQRQMLPYLNNEQQMILRGVLEKTLQNVTVGEETIDHPHDQNAVEAFITAKRIEGCSEKTLNYYQKTRVC